MKEKAMTVPSQSTTDLTPADFAAAVQRARWPRTTSYADKTGKRAGTPEYCIVKHAIQLQMTAAAHDMVISHLRLTRQILDAIELNLTTHTRPWQSINEFGAAKGTTVRVINQNLAFFAHEHEKRWTRIALLRWGRSSDLAKGDAEYIHIRWNFGNPVPAKFSGVCSLLHAEIVLRTALANPTPEKEVFKTGAWKRVIQACNHLAAYNFGVLPYANGRPTANIQAVVNSTDGISPAYIKEIWAPYGGVDDRPKYIDPMRLPGMAEILSLLPTCYIVKVHPERLDICCPSYIAPDDRFSGLASIANMRAHARLDPDLDLAINRAITRLAKKNA